VAAYLWYRNSDSMSAPAEIHGFVKKGFEAVREAFAENFSKLREVGAACCVYHKGEKVVDLWGGVRNIKTDEPWEEDTMAGLFGDQGLVGDGQALIRAA
jgi:Beta-lactamase